MRRSYLLALAVLLASTTVGAQTPAAPGRLSVLWEELTAADFVTAIRRAQGTCLLPFGIMEKHGPHLPLGSDLINVRYASLNAAQQEYAVVFPEHYVGQIFEAKHEPGTVRTAVDCSSRCCRRRATRWPGTAARRSSS